MAKVKLDLKSKTDLELAAFADNHITKITGNATYTTPSPTAVAFQAALDAFNTDLAELAAARSTVTEKVTDKEGTRAALETMLNQRGGYVDDKSGGDEAKIQSAGFEVRGTPAPIGELPAPGNLVTTTGDNEGEIDLTWNRVRGASAYEIECKVNTGPESWQAVKVVTNSRFTVTALIPGTVYAFRVRAIGAAGSGAWSDQAIRRAM
jgi:hypothetical protein